jgi:hypothetical protein
VEAVTGSRIWSYRDNAAVHLAVGALVCLFVLSPVLFTPWGFGPDFTNHLWLIWQQGVAIAAHGHPTLYLQQPGGVFQPFYGFYGGTLYATVGAVTALFGTNHAYSVYVVSYGISFAIAYGGIWWLGRQLGLSRWVSHLPAFVVVTGAYYLSDAYARGAWPELVALSAVPLFVAGAVRLVTGPWRPWPVALFAIGTVVMTGSHNLTLFWAVILIGPIAVVAMLVLGRERPSWRRIAMTAGLALLALGVNAWFLVLDLSHSQDVQAWLQGEGFVEGAFESFIYFDNIGNVLDPLRGFPSQSGTYGLIIAAPVAAFCVSVALLVVARPVLGQARRALKALWLILMAAMAVLVVMLVMPASWWFALGSPFTDIQFPYRLSGWLLITVAVQLAISLRFARDLRRPRRDIAIILSVALVALTVVQAAGQMYASPRVDHHLPFDFEARQVAFEGGPTTPPSTWYDPLSYADASLPVVEDLNQTPILVPTPSPGDTQESFETDLPKSAKPWATNIAGGPYVVRVEGVKVVGRALTGGLVIRPEPASKGPSRITVSADAGSSQTISTVISILCALAILALIGTLAIRPRLRPRVRTAG